MPKKKEEEAWKEYISSIKEKPQATKKGTPIGERLKQFLKRFGLGKKKKTSVEKQVEISAKEGKKLTQKIQQASKKFPKQLKGPEKTGGKKFAEPLHKLEKKGLQKPSKPLGIEKYLEKIEQKRRAESGAKKTTTAKKPGVPVKFLAKKPIPKPVVSKPLAGKKLVEKNQAARQLPGSTKTLKPVVLTKKMTNKPAGPAISKKISLLPKAKGKELRRKTVPVKTVKEIEKKVIKEISAEKPSLAKKTVKEIKKLPKTQVEKEVKKEIETETKEKRARGWYGDVLKHQRAALHGWHLRKRVKLHQLRKKKRKKKLTKKEQTKMRTLLSEEKELKGRLGELEEKIRTLEKISNKKTKQSKILEKKVHALGIKIPKIPLKKIKKSKEEFEKRSEFVELIKSMQSVANQMATAAAKKELSETSWKDAITVEDEMKTQEQLIKKLEVGFYKRKVDFEQFKEKMFEYQSKLSELRIKKRLTDERLQRLPPDLRAEIEKAKRTGVEPNASLSSRATKALEQMAEETKTHPKRQAFEEKTVEVLKKITEKQAERAVEKSQDRKFAERTADALQKIAQKLTPAQNRPVKEHPETKTPSQEHIPPQTPRQGTVSRPAEKQDPLPSQAPEPKPPSKEQFSRPPPAQRQESTPRQVTTPEPAHSQRPVERIIERVPSQETGPRRISKGPTKLSKKFVEQIRERVFKKESEQMPAGPMQLGASVDNAIKQKARASSVNPAQIADIEKKLAVLLKRYNIPENAVASHIQTLDSNRLVTDFQKLISLIETKKESAAAELIKPAPGFDINTGIISKKKEKIVGKEMEIKRAKIETSFDRVLNIIQVKGIINLDEAAKQLGMNKKDVQECAEILERSRLIKLSYPPIGPVKLIYPAYLKWKENEKKKKGTK